MNNETVYLLMICALLVLPNALQRLNIPAPLTSLLFGLGYMLFVPHLGEHHDAVQLLATLGISSLFLHAGLEVDLAELRRRWRAIAVYLSVRLVSLAVLSWLGWRLLQLPWQAAALLALALLTSSTGFIIDSMARFELSVDERFSITKLAIAGELLALAAMFFVLRSEDPMQLLASTATLVALLALAPLALLAIGRWVMPHAPNSEFSALVVVAFVAGHVTDDLGVEFLLGAFLTGVIARGLRRRLPALSTHETMHAVKQFSSFFIPFFFFLNGVRVPEAAIVPGSLWIGLGLCLVMLPLRYVGVWLQRRASHASTPAGNRHIAVSLMPTLIFALVLADILRRKYQIGDEMFGGLLVYAIFSTLLPSLVLPRRSAAETGDGGGAAGHDAAPPSR